MPLTCHRRPLGLASLLVAVTQSFRPVGLALVLAAALGCGAPGPEHVSIQLPGKRYVLAADEPLWKQPPPDLLRNDLTCGPSGRVSTCCPPPGEPNFDCTALRLDCDAGICALLFDLELARAVDLASEVPALAQRRGRVVSMASPPTLFVSASNRLNVALPAARLYLAPAGVRSSKHPEAQALGSIPRLAAGFEGTAPIRLGDQGSAALSRAVTDYQSRFTLIVVFPMVTRPDTPPPVGDAELTVTGTLTLTL